MGMNRVRADGAVSECSRCGGQVHQGRIRYHHSQLLCEECWDELFRIGVLKWLPFGEGAGRPEEFLEGELVRS